MEATEKLNLNKDQILFLAEEKDASLYIIESGKVMIFVQKGSEIIPVAYLGKGEFIGELSFFDSKKRSAGVICLEDTTFKKIPFEVMNEQFPDWLKIIGQQLTRKIRLGDELIRSKGIRKTNVESIKPLSISEQTRWFKLVDLHKSQKK